MPVQCDLLASDGCGGPQPPRIDSAHLRATVDAICGYTKHSQLSARPEAIQSTRVLLNLPAQGWPA